MALSNPSLTDVRNEFESSTRSSLNHTLRTFYEHVINTSSSGGKLSDFHGKGRPTASLGNVSTGTNNASLNATVDYKNVSLNRQARIRWGESSGNLNNTEDWTTSENPSAMISGLDANTTYYWTVEYYNAFNSHSSDWYTEPEGTFTTDEVSLADPVLNDVTFLQNNPTFDGQDYEFEFSNYDSNAEGYTLQWRQEGGSNWNTHGDLTNFNQVSGSTYTAEGLAVSNASIAFGTREFRIRAYTSSTESEWSNVETYTH